MIQSGTAFIDESRYIDRVATEQEAFIALYDHYFPRVYNYIRYRCFDADLTDDLTAQVFERALQKIAGFQPEQGSFGAWLFTIAHNLVSNYLRSRERAHLVVERLHDQPSGEPSPEERLVQAETEDELLLAFKSLSDRERNVLSLKYAARLTNRRIAAITGLKESHVAVIVHRALEKLRLRMDEQREITHERSAP
jgi:RNA polymerase sigma-70 factor (ECF subfamily)